MKKEVFVSVWYPPFFYIRLWAQADNKEQPSWYNEVRQKVNSWAKKITSCWLENPW
jgi:hypothetical protein